MDWNRRCQNKNVKGPDCERPFRCLCGSLLARLVPEGIELKCRRCKRHIIVPLEANFEEALEKSM